MCPQAVGKRVFWYIDSGRAVRVLKCCFCPLLRSTSLLAAFTESVCQDCQDLGWEMGG